MFRTSVNAIRSWKQLELGWVAALPADTPIEVNAAVGVLAHHLGFWSLNVYSDCLPDRREWAG